MDSFKNINHRRTQTWEQKEKSCHESTRYWCTMSSLFAGYDCGRSRIVADRITDVNADRSEFREFLSDDGDFIPLFEVSDNVFPSAGGTKRGWGNSRSNPRQESRGRMGKA